VWGYNVEFFKKQTNIDFMGIRHWTAGISLLLSVIALCVVFYKGLNFGLDFTGGTQIEVRYPAAIEIDVVRAQLTHAGFEHVKVAHYGSAQDLLIRLNDASVSSVEALQKAVMTALSSTGEQVELRRIEFVGSEVGSQLVSQGILAIALAIVAMMIYIAMRFEYRFAVSAAVALIHDPIIILGIFALFQIEFDLAGLTAILAVLGYSLNDTIVVFDRVRETFRRVRKGTTESVMNLSINQTLSRTLMTSFLTLLVVIALFCFGGESLHGFSTALLIGIIVGTYSSIYIAGALALAMGLSREDLLPVRRVIDESP